mgnify:CR=1 FL=1
MSNKLFILGEMMGKLESFQRELVDTKKKRTILSVYGDATKFLDDKIKVLESKIAAQEKRIQQFKGGN